MSQKGEIILYQDSGGESQIEVKLDGETVWLSQAQMAKLFQTNRTVITKHINNIYKDGELEEAVTTRKSRKVRQEGNRQVSREIEFYNLDMIISVGYRVNSYRGVQFRRWATEIIANQLKQKIWQSAEELFTKVLQSNSPNNRQTAGYVYLIKSSTGHYKIGRTGNLNNRLRTFSVKLPFEVEFVHVISAGDMMATERQLHQYFASKRVNGEWFSLTDDDVTIIRAWEH